MSRNPSHRATPLAVAAAFTAAGLVLVSTLASGSVVANAAPTTFNPFSVNGGFSLVSLGDATLGNGELEGSIAVTGNLQSSKQNFPIRHQASGSGDYTVPLVDGEPVRVLAGAFLGSQDPSFDVTNAEAPAGTPEALAGAKLVDIDALTVSDRGFLRVTNASGGTMDLKAMAYSADGLDRVATERASVEAYLGEVEESLAASAACFSSMYDPASQLAHYPTVTADGDLVTPTDFVADRPNVLRLEDIAGKTLKADRLDGWKPTAAAPLVIKAPAGTTTVGKLQFEGWSSGKDQDQKLSRYILLDLSEASGPVTIDGFEMGSVWAPGVDVTYSSGISSNGQWLVKNLTTSGGGELHHHAFLGNLPCGASTVDPSESPSPSAGPSLSESPSPSVKPSVSASPSVTPSASVPAVRPGLPSTGV